MELAEAKSLLFKAIFLIKSPSIRGLVNYILSSDTLEKFCIAPGGRGRHHAFKGGLAYHSAHSAFLAKSIVEHYDKIGIIIDEDIVYAGVLLHDVGKSECYKYSPTQNKVLYTKANNMFHHIPIGYGIVLTGAKEYNEVAINKISQEDIDHLLHIILSHHGNKKWSSPVIPRTLEAYLVHSLEMMDGYIDSYSKGNIPDRIY